MATVMSMHWPEVSKQQYEQVRNDVKWETDIPKGAKLHVSWWADDGFHVFDLWESPADFDHFVRNRLTAATQRAGITTQPKVDLADSYAIFAPNV